MSGSVIQLVPVYGMLRDVMLELTVMTEVMNLIVVI